MQNNVKSISAGSWIWIIFWFVLFWPIGVILLLRKLTRDRSAMMKDSRTVAFTSYLLIGVGVFWLLTGFAGNFLMTIMFISVGIWLNFTSRKMKATGDRYKKYISMIVNQSQTSIDNIASATGVSYEVAVKDLQKMIDSAYFTGAYIDVGNREIILAQTQIPEPQKITEFQTAMPQERVVSCNGCGANNRVTGNVGQCDYCGSPLQ